MKAIINIEGVVSEAVRQIGKVIIHQEQFVVEETPKIGNVKVVMLKGEKGDSGGGGGGTSDYSDLTNKPSINSVTLSGNKTSTDLGLASSSDLSGYIAKPSSPTAGQFLVYNGTAWVAQSLSTWSGGSY